MDISSNGEGPNLRIVVLLFVVFSGLHAFPLPQASSGDSTWSLMAPYHLTVQIH